MSIFLLSQATRRSWAGPESASSAYASVLSCSRRFTTTGVRSVHPYHLEQYPWRMESGTPNIVGASRPSVGGQGRIAAKGLESAHRREMVLAGRLVSGLREIAGVRLCCCESMQNHLSTVSVNIEGMEAAGGGVASFSPNNPCDMLHRRKTFGLQPFGHLPSFRSAWFPGIGRRMKSPVRNARVHAGFVQPSCP